MESSKKKEELASEEFIEELFYTKEAEEQNEVEMCHFRCNKISPFNRPTLRTIVLSTHSVFLLSATDVRTKHAIKKLSYIVRSQKSDEIMLFFAEKCVADMRLLFVDQDEREEFLSLLQLRFSTLCQHSRLKIYLVPEAKLKIYSSANMTAQSGYGNEPAEKYRLFDQEVKTQAEVDRERTISVTTFDMDFDPVGRESLNMPKNLDDEDLLDDVDLLAADFNDGGGILDTGGADNLEPIQFEIKSTDPSQSLAIPAAAK